jgi:ribosomal protein L37AE/L43A
MDKKQTLELVKGLNTQGNKPKCPQCDSLTIIYRVRANDYLCRRCGHSWPKEKP